MGVGVPHLHEDFASRMSGGAAGKGKQKELTEEQKQEIKEAFDLFDTDGMVSERSERFRAFGMCAGRSGRAARPQPRARPLRSWLAGRGRPLSL